MRKTRTVVIAAGLGAVLASSLPAPSPASETRVIVALVSSNMREAFAELARRFSSQRRDVTIRAQYLGGTQIGDMIDQQVPADIVIIDRTLSEPRLALLNAPHVILRNREIVLVPRSNPGKLRTFRDLGNPGVRIAVGSSTASVGQIASQVVQNAAGDFGFEFVRNVRRNLTVEADRESSVIGALKTQEANAAFAFQSEQHDADYIAIPIDQKYNIVSTYIIAVPKNALNAALAADLVKLVAGRDGRAVLHRFNFMPPE
jgi:ABC-type molybdate transport system substrate-binding protein